MSKQNGDFSWKESVNLRDYFETILKEFREDYKDKIDSLDKKVELRFNMKDQALDTAYKSMDTRLQGMNEFRASLSDASKTFLTRDMYDAKHELLQKQVDDLRMNQANLAGKASASSVWVSYLFTGVALLMSLIHYFTNI